MIAYGSRGCSTFCRYGAPAGRYSGMVKVESASVLSPKFVEEFSGSADGRQPVARGASRWSATAHTIYYSLFPARRGRGQWERASHSAYDSRRVLNFAPRQTRPTHTKDSGYQPQGDRDKMQNNTNEPSMLLKTKEGSVKTNPRRTNFEPQMRSLNVKSEHSEHANVPAPEVCKPHEAGLENESTLGRPENRGKTRKSWKRSEEVFENTGLSLLRCCK